MGCEAAHLNTLNLNNNLNSGMVSLAQTLGPPGVSSNSMASGTQERPDTNPGQMMAAMSVFPCPVSPGRQVNTIIGFSYHDTDLSFIGCSHNTDM